MKVEVVWQVIVTRRNGSMHRYTERRGRRPERGEVLEVRDAIGPPLIARIDAIHHAPQAPGALPKWNVAAIEIVCKTYEVPGDACGLTELNKH
jgi:hypothetical protein